MSKMLFFVKIKFAIEKALDKWSRRAQMIKTRKWRESIEKQMKNKDEKES